MKRTAIYIDGLHVTPAGHRAMGDWLAPLLGEALPQAEPA